MKKLILLLSLLLASSALAQEARNAAYVELGGSGILLTVNYERHFAKGLAGRVGFSYVTSSSDSGDTDSTFVVPLTLSKITRPTSNHHFEYGGGLTFVNGDTQDLFDDSNDEETLSDVYLSGIAGYRYQKPGRGVVFRAAFTPLVGNGDFFPLVGVSIGYAW